MGKDYKDLCTLTFDGPDYDDHGLEVDDLGDLQAYKKILLGVAEDVWRRKNPDRKNIQKGWRSAVNIRFFGISPGSASVLLKREIELENNQAEMGWEDEFDAAADIVYDSISAAINGEPLPESLPKSVIPIYREFGAHLHGENRIRVSTPQRSREVAYTPEVRDRLANWVEQTYHDEIDLVGEVRSTDLGVRDADGGTFTLRLKDGSKVKGGRFTNEEEHKVTEALKEHRAKRLQVFGVGEFDQSTGKLRKIVETHGIVLSPAADPSFDATAQPIWDVIAQLGAEVPDAEWDKLPSDLSKNVDHYLYGCEKKAAE